MNYTHRRDFSTYARAGGTVYTCAYAAERATPWLGSLEGWCSIVVLAGLERGRNLTSHTLSYGAMHADLELDLDLVLQVSSHTTSNKSMRVTSVQASLFSQ